MLHEVNIIDDQLIVLDENGNGLAHAALDGYRAAQQQLQRWSMTYAFDVASAGKAIREYAQYQRHSGGARKRQLVSTPVCEGAGVSNLMRWERRKLALLIGV